MRNVIAVNVDFGSTPTLIRHIGIDCVRSQVVVNCCAHVILNVFVSKRKPTKGSNYRSTRNSSTIHLRRNRTFGRTITPIVGYKMAIFINSCRTPGLRIGNIGTFFVHYSTIDEWENTAVIFAIVIGIHSKTISISCGSSLVMLGQMVWIRVRIDNVASMSLRLLNGTEDVIEV